ncbi:extensin family protein [Pseudenhygromyxa sp. WMMC2535]|uniref:extensin family protein n=1 Tax=Pseudenhygromyxa sp. WMMC2535 TaxID=2712867 RepID=UPI001557F3C3|nr:extensin family protein [Pseudenhygromyxa sp. WMMC2535]
MNRSSPARLLLVLVPTLFGCDGSRTSTPEDPSIEPPAAAALTPTPTQSPPELAPDPEQAPALDSSGDDSQAPEAPTQPQRVSWGHADLDPDNDAVIGPPEPLDDCEDRLQQAGVSFKPARIGVGKKRDGVYTCGAHQVVRFRRGPGKIAYSSNPLLTCTMAVALADFERVAQEEADRIMGSRITAIDHIGTYNCREMVNYDMLSEHSFANGIDLKTFHFANGESADVKADFQPELDEPPSPQSEFLRALANRLYDEEVFSVVVTPYFDRLHHNHIHMDLARYRVDGSRP